MKNIGYIFVDDGYPEAEEYETNYIRCSAEDPVGPRLSETLVFRDIPLDSVDGRRLHRAAIAAGAFPWESAASGSPCTIC